MITDELQINSLLCFLQSASNDFPAQTLSDLIFSFYSYEEIKLAKELVYEILNKKYNARNDPNKKIKELDDVVETFNEYESCKSRSNKVRFVCDNYKKMPPLGLEFISPLLVNLSEEVNKINEILPRILDIKSEVIKTADTVRDMKAELIDVSSLINKSLQTKIGQTQHAIPIQQRNLSIKPNNLFGANENKSRYTNSDSDKNVIQLKNSFEALSNTPNQTTTTHLTPRILNGVSSQEGASENVLSNNDHENQKCTNTVQGGSGKFYSANKNEVAEQNRNDSIGPDIDDQGNWIPVGSGRQRRSSRKVTGIKLNSGSFKAAVRTCDIFIGRVDKEVSEEGIKDYIKNTFNVTVSDVEKLVIKTNSYNAFKVCVNFKDRDALFSRDLWPEGIVVGKYYNRSTKS